MIQSVIEESGIPTTSVTMLKEITKKVSPPRALFVDTPLGYPLGRARDAGLRREILSSALSLLSRSEDLPILEDFLPIQAG